MKQLLPIELKGRLVSLNKLFLTAAILLFMLIPFAGMSQANYEWGNVSIGGGGFVSAIITSPNEEGLIYARTDVGGAYRWDKENKRWIPLTDWVDEGQTSYLGVESLAIDPTSPNKLYMQVGIPYFNGGKTAILRSEDYGQTFSIVDVSSQFKANGNGMGRQNGEKLVVDANSPNILFTGTRWNGLFKSTNSGESWTRVVALDVTTTPNENGISFVVLDSLSSPAGTPTKTIFVGVSRFGENLYRSDDGGATFTAVSGGPTDLMPQRAVLDNAGNFYITYANGAGPHPHWAQPEPFDKGRVMKLSTETGKWTNVTPFSNNRPYGGISVDPNNPNRIITSTINTWLLQERAYGDRFFLSTDGGASWTDIIQRGYDLDENGFEWISNQSIHWSGSIEFDPFNTKKVWVTSGNGVYSTDDVDATPSVWKFTVEGLEETVPINLVSIPGGPLVSVILDYDGFIHEDITQGAKIHKPGMGSTYGLAFAAQNTDVMLRYGDKLFYTLDGGDNWIETSHKGKKGQVAISADGEVFIHSPAESPITFRSTDRGATWTGVTGINYKGAMPMADPENSDKFYIYNPSNGNMYVSTDKGVSFSIAGAPGGGGSKIIRTVPGHEGNLWVALYGGGLTRSTDSGATFTKLKNVKSAGAVGIGKAAPGKDYPTIFIWGVVDNVLGIHMSTDEGQSWTRINDDAHEFGGPGNGQFIVGDMNVYGRVYMSTAGRGIVYGEPGCSFSVVQSFMQIEGEEKQPVQSLMVGGGTTLILSPEASEGGSWNWSGPNGFSSDSREVRLEDLTVDGAGDYIVVYTNAEGCASPPRKFTVEVEPATALAKDQSKNTLVVFPNPNSGSMTINVPAAGFSLLQIVDMKGKTVLQRKVSGTESQMFVQTSLPQGVYFIQLKSSKKVLTSKIIVK